MQCIMLQYHQKLNAVHNAPVSARVNRRNYNYVLCKVNSPILKRMWNGTEKQRKLVAVTDEVNFSTVADDDRVEMF